MANFSSNRGLWNWRPDAGSAARLARPHARTEGLSDRVASGSPSGFIRYSQDRSPKPASGRDPSAHHIDSTLFSSRETGLMAALRAAHMNQPEGLRNGRLRPRLTLLQNSGTTYG